MNTIGSVAELEALYDNVVPGAVTKVRAELTPLYQKWIGASRFVILTTVGPAGMVDHLPVGYQAIAGQYQDYTAIQFAELVEKEIIGFTPPPGYDD